jgi:hypothetical protein
MWIQESLYKIQSRWIDQACLHLARLWFRQSGSIPRIMRMVMLSIWSSNPLKREKSPPEIDLAVVFAEKDCELIPFVVAGAIQSSANPIRVVRLVTPDWGLCTAEEALSAIRELQSTFGFALETFEDEELLGRKKMEALRHHRIPDRGFGWVVQQVLKLSVVLMSQQRATLVVCADTVLTYKRTWLDSAGRQLLLANEWFRSLWTDDVESFLQLKKSIPLSFITHHQLMQREIVAEIFGERGERLVDWATSASRRIAEYETYGTFLYEVYPKRAVVARFGNVEVSNRQEITLGNPNERHNEILGVNNENTLSISLHHYLENGTDRFSD